jgi:uncharacterized protein
MIMKDAEKDIAPHGASGLHFTPEGAAASRDFSFCAIADLHIGFERSWGISLARMQLSHMSQRIDSAMSRFSADTLIIDGDLRHGFGKLGVAERSEISGFLSSLCAKYKVEFIHGNHDNAMQFVAEGAGIKMRQSLRKGKFVFTHGDKPLSKKPGDIHIIGNEHPAVTLRDGAGGSRKYPCFLFLEKEKIAVLPAFNPWSPGTDMLSIARGCFLSPALNNADMESARAILTDWEELYDFKKIKDIRKIAGRK